MSKPRKKQAQATRPMVAYALHTFQSGYAEQLAADELRIAARAQSFHDPVPVNGGLVEIRAVNGESDETIRNRILAIAECMLNPSLGFRRGTDPKLVQQIAAGFARIEAVSNLVARYVSATLAIENDDRRVNVDLWLPTKTLPFSVVITGAGAGGLGMASLLGVETLPDDVLRNIVPAETPAAWSVTREGDRLVVDRLLLQHQAVGPADAIDAMRIAGDPALAGIPFEIVHAQSGEKKTASVDRDAAGRYDLLRDMLQQIA